MGLSVFRHQRKSCRDRLFRTARLKQRVFEHDFAGVERVRAEQRPRHFGSTRAYHPGQAENLALVERQAGRARQSFSGDICSGQHGRAARASGPREDFVERPTDHHLNQPGAADLADLLRADNLPVLQDGDIVGDLEDLVEPVRDVNNRDAQLDQRTNNREQAVEFLSGQNCRRLVHDDEIGVLRQGLGDLDHLLAGDGQIADVRRGREPNAEPLEQVGAFFGHPPHVDDAESIARLTAEENILADGHELDEI